MVESEIDEFAKLIVQNVRDRAIRSCDSQLHSKNLNSPIAKRWHKAKSNVNIDEFAEMIIADSIDDAIFYLLDAIDNSVINISFTGSNGKTINLCEDGLSELGGNYADKWASMYSKERYFDYLNYGKGDNEK